MWPHPKAAAALRILLLDIVPCSPVVHDAFERTKCTNGVIFWQFNALQCSLELKQQADINAHVMPFIVPRAQLM